MSKRKAFDSDRELVDYLASYLRYEAGVRQEALSGTGITFQHLSRVCGLAAQHLDGIEQNKESGHDL